MPRRLQAGSADRDGPVAVGVVTTPRLLMYGALGFPLAMAALPLYVHLPRYYALTRGMDLALLGALLLAARAIDAVQDPLIGWLGDRHARDPATRLRWACWATVPLALGMTGLFHAPPAGALGTAGWLMLNLLLAYTAFSVATISYQAYGAELSRDSDQRTRVAAAREGLALLGVLFAAALPEWLVGRYGAVAGYGYFTLVFAVVLAAGAAVTWYGSPAAPAGAGDAAAGAWRTVRGALANAPFRRLLVVFVLNGVAGAIPATLILFFIADVIGRPQQNALFLAGYFAAGAAGMPAWVMLARRWGRAATWGVAMLASVVAFVWAARLGHGDSGPFLAVCVLSGLCFGADMALPSSLLADVTDAGHAGGTRAGIYFGLWNLASKFNLALAAGIALPLLDFAGYRPGVPTDAGRAALGATYALLPCGLKTLAAVALWRAYGRVPQTAEI